MRSLALCLALLAAFLTAGTLRAAPVKAGFAERDITPEIGMERPGGYGKSFHDSIHDPCKVRAAVFDDGERRVALVGIDALVILRPQVEAARKAIHERCGIAPDAVLFGASHSHSSGPTGMILPGDYDHAPEEVRALAYEKSSNADPKFLAHFEKQLADAVVAANESRVDARLSFGRGSESNVSFNRRFRMRNGLTFTHPNFGNPDILEPAGPIDPEVGVIGAWDADETLLGAVVTFACHATTSPPGASANYIYYIEKTLREHTGNPSLPVIFLNGASGDITQVDNTDPWGRMRGEDAAPLVGGAVGAEAMKALLHARSKKQFTQTVPVEAKTQILAIPRRRPSPERLARSWELVRVPPKPGGRPVEWTFAKEIVLLDALIAKEPVCNLEIQAVKVGPAVFVTTPAEYFVQFGLDQKAAIRFPFTWPVSLANGCVGYVPTEEALGSGGGGYETRLTSYSNLVPSAGRTMADAGIALANSMTPGPLPAPEKPPPFAAPWDYGAVPPELD